MSTRPERVRGTALWPLLVLGVALSTTALKLRIAATTFGTNDAHSWIDFARGVREYGLIHVYGHEYFTQYNHPPLAGLMLAAVNGLVDARVVDLGELTVPLLVRVPASVADVGSALLVFLLIRRRRSDRSGALAGVLVALSPVLVVISGFHANTDPVFVMFVLLAVYAVERGWGFTAGVAFMLALSVKLVPVVVAPVLVVALIQRGWHRLGTFVIGVLVVFVPLWGPVLQYAWPEFSTDVLGYNGVSLREWGIPQFLAWWRVPPEWTEVLVGSGRFAVLGISALVPALLVWRRPDALGAAAGLSLALFLLLSPAFGMQYTVWPLAAAYLIGSGAATLYNAAASVYVVTVYDNWNGIRAARGPLPPWEWYEGVAVEARPVDLQLMVIAWTALAIVVVAAFVRRRRRPVLSPPVPDAAEPRLSPHVPAGT